MIDPDCGCAPPCACWKKQEALAAAQARAKELEAALREVWESVPASNDENDPTVRRHARALNAISPLLSPPSTVKGDAKLPANSAPVGQCERCGGRVEVLDRSPVAVYTAPCPACASPGEDGGAP